MPEYPLPHFEDHWSYDLLEDYEQAKSDDERRYLLLRFGYDKSHKAEAEYLFNCRFDDSGQPHKNIEEDHKEVEPCDTTPDPKRNKKFYQKWDFWCLLVAVLSLAWSIVWGILTYFEIL